MILRLFGRGRTVLPGSAEWEALIGSFPEMPGARQLVVVDVHRVATACGFGVPTLGEPADRDQLVRWAENKGDDGLAEYRRKKNTVSIDGLPAAIAD
jgi:hypothetical protein